jgi:type II secretory ATPase GspE/PulE/Tfp pilus assembly ATPase PilB-like protein/CheY-like chemotaxis protein
VASTEFQVVASDGRGLFTGLELESPAVVKFGDLVLQEGVRLEASELHLEPGRKLARIRARIDGVMQTLADVPPEAQARLVARLKHQASMSEVEGKGILLRNEEGEEWRAHLSPTETPHGEILTVRLSAPGRFTSLDQLGFPAPVAASIRGLLEKGGLILVAGLARTGKSTFVYSALRELSHASTVSLENPVEREIPGITQVAFDPSKGLSFAETLQQLLGQNPEVVFAGELRDLATARTALRAAVTGRKVLATVHAVDVISSLRRLLDMGLAPGRLAESLGGVVSLRLVRRLCPACARPFDPSRSGGHRERALMQMCGVVPPREAVGCPACASTGFRGQVPVGEILQAGPVVRGALTEESTEVELRAACRKERGPSLEEQALDLVRGGETTLEEVERVLGAPPRTEDTPKAAGPVLVVEDEEQDRLMIRSLLGRMGFDVVEAPDGPAALRLLESGGQGFSLMVLDLILPGMPGQDVLKRVREAGATANLPVLVLTGSSKPQDEIDLLDAGADDYVMKPVVSARLEARIRAVLRRSGLGHLGEA